MYPTLLSQPVWIGTVHSGLVWYCGLVIFSFVFKPNLHVSDFSNGKELFWAGLKGRYWPFSDWTRSPQLGKGCWPRKTASYTWCHEVLLSQKKTCQRSSSSQWILSYLIHSSQAHISLIVRITQSAGIHLSVWSGKWRVMETIFNSIQCNTRLHGTIQRPYKLTIHMKMTP